jgi:hypothetical protein
MRKGDIVRQKALNGLMGSYMRIEYIEQNRLYCGALNSDTPNVILFKDRAMKISRASLQVPDEKLQTMIRKNREGFEFQEITHPITPRWMEIHYEAPRIIKLYSNKKNEFYFKLFFVEIVRNLRENVIKITLQRL